MDHTSASPPCLPTSIEGGKVHQLPTDEEAGKKYRQRLEQLRSHPLFGDLQMTLALDCLQSSVPLTLLTESTNASASASKTDKKDLAFCTVSEKIIEQHVKLQSRLLALHSFFPSLLGIYQQITEQMESQRYRALAYNCYSDDIKQKINLFYDSERQQLIDRIQESVNLMTGVNGKSPSALPKLNGEFICQSFTAHSNESNP